MTARYERDYMDHVASLPCACCGATGVHVHHIREGQGLSQRASNWLTIPLCPDCHTGPRGIHGDKSSMRLRKLDELTMLANTIKAINQQ